MSQKPNILTPSGFPEFTPAQERVAQDWLNVIRDVFEKYGFMPITTPLVEREDNLVAKGGNPKEIYVLKRLLDEDGDRSHSGNAVRFDHTVPLALYVARHLSEISFPFRRYVIGPVMRGERAQKGRYRQFDQCDIDVIGSEKLSFLNDAQMPVIIAEIFEQLNIGDFIVRINNRKILKGLLALVGIAEIDAKKYLDIVDDLEKIGEKKVSDLLGKEGLSSDAIAKILAFCELKGDPDSILQTLEKDYLDVELLQEGVTELRQVIEGVRALGLAEDRFKIDLSIARGLDYYTGTVFETHLVGYESLGSICSGGRYEDLAQIFTGKKLPGVGISMGFTRLLHQLFDAGILKAEKSSPSDILVIATEPELLPEALKLASELRSAGNKVENYVEVKKLAKQFDYANKLGIGTCVVIGPKEMGKGTVIVKNMETGEQAEVERKDIRLQ